MKKGTKKKAIQENLEPQEIKFKFESGRMIFEMGDRQFFLSEKQGREVSFRVEQLRTLQEEDFSKMNTKDFMAKFDVTYEHFDNLEDTAKFLKIDSTKLRRWMNQDGREKEDALHSGPTDEFGKLKEAYKREFFGEEKREEIKSFNPDMKMIDKIANFVMKKYGPREISKRLRVDYGSFINWFTRGEPQKRIQHIIRNKQ